MYTKVFRSLGMNVARDEPSPIPLLGITATPYRSNDYQTRLLHRQYDNNILAPNGLTEPADGFDDSWKDYDFVLNKLTEEHILSVPHYYYVPSESVFQMSKTESETLEHVHRLPPELLDRVGRDPSRNLVVYEIIKKWADSGRNILFFGANINQAIMMKEFLNQDGIRSAVITSETKFGYRHMYVKMFRKRKIRVLCNYGVLATGFDSPKVDTVIIARPTGSRLMYEQMVGRGLRGPKFGGTQTCDIITVLDNILNYDRKRITQGHEEFARSTEGITPEERSKINRIGSQYEAANPHEPQLPEEGEMFTEGELYETFLVQTQGGIRFTHRHNLVVLVDADSSNYKDRVDEESGTITYIGTGEDDQGFEGGIGGRNDRVRNSESVLLYFQKPEKNNLIFRYCVKYDSHSFGTEKNRKGKNRKVIRFKLRIIRKMCPSCTETFASSDREIEEKFGFRSIGGRTVPQSWCKKCRS